MVTVRSEILIALVFLPVAIYDALDYMLFHRPILCYRSTSVQGIQRTVKVSVKEERYRVTISRPLINHPVHAALILAASSSR